MNKSPKFTSPFIGIHLIQPNKLNADKRVFFVVIFFPLSFKSDELDSATTVINWLPNPIRPIKMIVYRLDSGDRGDWRLT